MDLAGWTNDRLVASRLARLDRSEWVFGTPNASIVMAAFLHVAPSGMRFNSPDLGAWYAAGDLNTAVAEVAHHLRREAVARGLSQETRTYRAYRCVLLGDYVDVRGRQAARPDLYDPVSYAAAQVFGEQIRASGGDGVIYDSLRKAGGTNVAAHRPRNVTAIVQADHLKLTVNAASRRIEVERLSR